MMTDELTLLIKLTEGLYKKTKWQNVEANEVDIGFFVKLASKNNLLFYVSKQILNAPLLTEENRKRFQKIVSDGEIKLAKVKKSLKEINEHLPKSLIFKTYRGTSFIRIPSDIDVLAKNFQDSIKKFISHGYYTAGYLPKEGSIHLLRDDIYKIHLHNKISWAWEDFFDNDFIYQNPRNEVFNGQEVTIPNITADVLIHLAHMNFEPLHIGLGELLYLFTIIPQMNFNKALEQADMYSWKRTFLRTLNLINNIHYFLYGKVLIKVIPFKKRELENIEFPYCFSRTHLILSALEKRLFIYPLTRIFKMINILITRDTYTKYISPADRETKDPREA